MPRIIQNEKVYREKDFLAEVAHQKVMRGVRTDKEIAEQLGVHPSVYCRLKQDLDNLSVGQLRKLVAMLGLEPWAVLRLLGYKKSTKIMEEKSC